MWPTLQNVIACDGLGQLCISLRHLWLFQVAAQIRDICKFFSGKMNHEHRQRHLLMQPWTQTWLSAGAQAEILPWPQVARLTYHDRLCLSTLSSLYLSSSCSKCSASLCVLYLNIIMAPTEGRPRGSQGHEYLLPV